LPQGKQLASLDLFAAFDYQTSKYVNMQLESLAHIEVQTYGQVPIRSIMTVGSLDFI